MPTCVIIDDIQYDINTDFRVALECNKIAQDKSIGRLERALAIIYKLFGDKGLESTNHHKQLLEYAKKYLACGKTDKDFEKIKKREKFELDFDKCVGLIKSSFKYDYQYDPYAKEYLHWYEFNNDLMNLSTSEFGTCCALNRVSAILNQDPKDIKDSKNRSLLIDTQNDLKEQYCVNNKKEITKEQKELVNKVYEAFGLRKE